MAVFQLDDNKIRVISERFGLPPANVRQIYDEYNEKINSLMAKQYLGHSIRAMEQFVYAEKGKRSFHVRCMELDKILLPVYCDYDSYFLVWYPKNLNETEVRMAIAHELGHLFFNTKERRQAYDETAKKNLEAVANVFGYFLLMGRNAFYSGKEDPFQDSAWQSIMTEYEKFCTT
jgi:Zn-dependent peptidase ImmA (M78 family)